VTYSYLVYGLRLQSRSAIEGLGPPTPQGGPLVDHYLEVSIGRCPDWAAAALQLPGACVYSSPVSLDRSDAAFQLSQLGGGQFFQLSYFDGTRFVVDRQTRRIWGTCPPPLTQEDLVTYLVGPVLGFVLRRRGIMALHSGSFSRSGFAFALCGGPGAGKSTTVAALASRGVRIQCEDITALRERQSVFWAAPGYPRVNLWPESAANLFGTPIALPKITPTWEKRFLSLDGHATKFENRERQLAAVYLLDVRSNGDDSPRIEDLSARDAALLLVQNTYMNYLLSKKQRAKEFDIIARLASRVTVRRLVPHNDPARLPAMCELLEIDAARIAETVHSTSTSQRR